MLLLAPIENIKIIEKPKIASSPMKYNLFAPKKLLWNHVLIELMFIWDICLNVPSISYYYGDQRTQMEK
jgi:hypothetical protein